ncbi:hypothetical protein AAK899_01750 [Erysipelotrichaceae bacterium 51-3]|uniref:hypothetical protein n=1 Tax=Allobaculum sp. JKK-2023 TaxID=3108943 RepID=UPI002B05F5B5|nr:hypothetical protein [Allobaculum sp. JKK-2023]
MKAYLTKYWWLMGIIGSLLLLLCSRVGWYALVNFLIVGMAVYVNRQASQRKVRIEGNLATLRKMNKVQKRKFLEADAKEVRTIQSSNRMLMYLCLGAAILDAYTFFYNSKENIRAALIQNVIPETLDPYLLAFGLALNLVFYFAFVMRMNENMVKGVK